MSEHGSSHGGGGGNILGPLSEAMNPIRPLDAAMEHGTDEVLDVLALLGSPAFTFTKLVDKMPDPLSFKKSGGGGDKPAGISHGGH